MKNLLISVSVMSLLAVAAFGETLSGTISDSNCGAKHTAAAAADQGCVKGCIKKGATPVLVSEGKVYKFSSASLEKIKEFYGQKVSIDGTVDGDTIKVESVKAS